MADLHFVDFALIPSPVRKEKQFRLPDDFSEFDFTVLSRTSHSAFGFPALFRVCTSHHGQTAVRRSAMALHDEGEARNFNISVVRGRIRRLLTALMEKERSLVELKVFWLQRRVFYWQNIVKVSLAVHLACS